MTVVTKITTHVADGLDLLLSQFNDSERLRDFVEAVLTEVQRLEDLAWDVMTLRILDNATGVNLDIIGEIVGQPRYGITDDDEYRRLIKVRIQINRHDCQAEQTAWIWRQLLPGEPVVEYRAHPPAHFQLFWNSTGTPVSQDWLDIIVPLMPLLACMGVSWELIEAGDDGYWQFDVPARAFDSGKFSRRVDV